MYKYIVRTFQGRIIIGKIGQRLQFATTIGRKPSRRQRGNVLGQGRGSHVNGSSRNSFENRHDDEIVEVIVVAVVARET
jgi:hypothetical protein